MDDNPHDFGDIYFKQLEHSTSVFFPRLSTGTHLIPHLHGALDMLQNKIWERPHPHAETDLKFVQTEKSWENLEWLSIQWLEIFGFTNSKFNECLIFRGDIIFIVYVDDGIFAYTSDAEINKAIKDSVEKKYDIEDKETLADYLEVNIVKLPDRMVKLSQPLIIDQVI